MAKKYEDDSDNEGDSNKAASISDWKLTGLNSDGFEIQLDVQNPLLMSQDVDPDYLLIQLSLSKFKDSNDQSLPESLIKKKDIPRQMASQEDAE